MGTIVVRQRADGSTAYMAKIVVKKDGHIIHRESKTFDRRPAARAWMDRRERELKQPGAIERATADRHTLAHAIDRYIEESVKEIGRTKAQVINAIKKHAIARMDCSKIKSSDIVEFATQLSEGRKPSTVGNYMSHLASIFTVARPAWGYELDRQVMEDALTVAGRLGIIAKANERDRRPTLEELDILLRHFADRQKRRRSSVPMVHIIAFAIFSTRRQEEIIRIRWDDFEPHNKRVLVRDMKNPGDKIGNHVWCDLTPEAIRIIEAMPRQAEQIFPYTTDAIGASLTRACKTYGIKNLRFHDLRHEGISRLFELGLNIPQVACVSGHRSWTSLKRYTHIRQCGDKYEGWNWIEAATTPPTLRLTRKGELPRRLRSNRQPHLNMLRHDPDSAEL